MFRQKDHSIIKENIYNIEEKAYDMFMRNHHQPSIKEYQDVIKLIKPAKPKRYGKIVNGKSMMA